MNVDDIYINKFKNYFSKDTLLIFSKRMMVDIYGKFPILQNNTRYMKNIFKNNKYPLILDIGCGQGDNIRITKRILPGAKIFALDIVEQPMLPKKCIDNFNIVDIDNSPLPYAEETFDYIYMQHVLEHLHNPFFVLKECNRVLKKGGYLYLEVPDARWTLLPHIPFITGKSGGFSFWDDPTHLRPWTRPALARAAQMTGFSNTPKTFYVRKLAHMLSFPLMFLSRNDDFKIAFLHSILGLWCGLLIEK